MIQIFADGSYSHERQSGGYSAVIVDTEKKDFHLSITGSTARSNIAIMELRAILEGLKLVPCKLKVRVYTDRQDIIDIVRGTAKQNSKTTGWDELWNELRQVLSERQVEWKKVKAHRTGNTWHQMADRLARQAMRAEIK